MLFYCSAELHEVSSAWNIFFTVVVAGSIYGINEGSNLHPYGRALSPGNGLREPHTKYLYYIGETKLNSPLGNHNKLHSKLLHYS